jgi:hypothetical protein
VNTFAIVAVAALSIAQPEHDRTGHGEGRHDALLVPATPLPTSPPALLSRGPFMSIQVNTDANGMNILGDAANEPSIAVDPLAPNRIVIGWRQFDTIASNFRQAGNAHSRDGGRTWTSHGVLDPGVFRSDPVLATDDDGRFYYYSLTVDDFNNYTCQIFRSEDAGLTWTGPIPAYGGDKQWLAVDRTGGLGHGNIYGAWDHYGCCGIDVFSRSIDYADGWTYPVPIPEFPIWGVTDVGPDGAVYVAGRTRDTNRRFVVARSSNAQYANQTPEFDLATDVPFDGRLLYFLGEGPNPGGLLGQVWIATDHSGGATHGNVYVLSSMEPDSGSDPLDVMITRSEDGGLTWSDPVRVNDDAGDNWQWFGTLSVAPNGRLDAVWYDTRDSGQDNISVVYYSYSLDAGETWAPNVPVSPAFDSLLGWPNQNKLGDYIHMISDEVGAHLAYAATFNAEQDVYYLRIGEYDCNDNGLPDDADIAGGWSGDCNANAIPDECEIAAGTLEDDNGNGIPDICECPPDINADGSVNSQDFVLYLNLFVAGDPRADYNLDGTVNSLDFSAFLNDFVAGC